MASTKLFWDYGTAYDMFISLAVLHEPDRYGLRGAWAAGVRSRLPNPERDLMQRMVETMGWPLHWVCRLPDPRDGETVLTELRRLEPQARLKALLFNCYVSDEWQQTMLEVAERGRYTRSDTERLLRAYNKRMEGKKKKSAKKMRSHIKSSLELWANAEEFGDGLYTALETYYDVFFAEEEARILPALRTAVTEARALSQSMDLPELLEELSAGLRFSEEMTDMDELLLVPSFWGAPLMLLMKLSESRQIMVFGGRPQDASLVPGEVVPDALFQALKSLADPTRLRILRYLSEEPLTPAELARRLRLRAPTVIHHLHTLRLARLVNLTFMEDEGGKRYEARREAVTATFELLDTFLDADKVSTERMQPETAVVEHVAAD